MLSKEQIEKMREGYLVTGNSGGSEHRTFLAALCDMALASLEAEVSVDREIARWQALLVHHEQLEGAVKAYLADKSFQSRNTYLEMERIVAVQGYDDTLQAILDAHIRQARIEGAREMERVLTHSFATGYPLIECPAEIVDAKWGAK